MGDTLIQRPIGHSMHLPEKPDSSPPPPSRENGVEKPPLCAQGGPFSHMPREMQDHGVLGPLVLSSLLH